MLIVNITIAVEEETVKVQPQVFKGKVHCVQCVKLLKREGLTIVLTELKITQDKHRLSDS